jgi:hypothetical protein
VSHYMVSASGINPLDSMVLRRRERVNQKLDGSHSVTSTHSALNMYLRQNLGMAQQDIENLITETQESFKMYTVTSSGTTAWLSVITLLAVVLIYLIVRKFCQRRRERSDDTVFVPTLSSYALLYISPVVSFILRLLFGCCAVRRVYAVMILHAMYLPSIDAPCSCVIVPLFLRSILYPELSGSIPVVMFQ